MTFSPIILLLLLETSLAQKYKFINNANDLIKLSNDVYDGSTFENYTIYLASDIIFNEELSQQYRPVSRFDNIKENYFLGTFDGQGYVISNLVISSSSYKFFGLFGFSYGLTIRNVILDDSCSISSSFESTTNDLYLGGIIAYCYGGNGHCTIENTVNMASVTFTGVMHFSYYMGGITSCCKTSKNQKMKIMNCVNYGKVHNTGKGDFNGFIGGIVGYTSFNGGPSDGLMLNCFNYGAVTNSGSGSASYYVGGINGITYGAIFENCVNIGKVTSSSGDVGSIIGNSGSNSPNVTHCYWTGSSSYYGKKSSTINESNITKISSLNSGIAHNLNTYAVNNKWNEWTYNQNSASVKFVVNNNKGFSYSSQLILLPEPVRRGCSFLFWCVNQNSADNCEVKYNRTITSGFTGETTLYAQWAVTNCTIALDVNGGDELSIQEKNITAVFDTTYGESFPVPTKRGHEFVGWYTIAHELVTAESLVNDACNCSLYAKWAPNKYTVTFDVNGGVELDSNSTVVIFNSKYGELPSPNRSGFDFTGWFTEEGENITNEKIVNVTNNCTLYAHWAAKTYTVKLNVNGGDELIGFNDDGIELPSDEAHEYLLTPTRKGYTFAGWFTEGNVPITNGTATTGVITEDQTLYAHWVANNYTVEFDVNGGDELPKEESNTTVTYDNTYDSLPMPSREGYTFTGWFNENDEEITSKTKVVIISDCTLHAQWTANNYTISFNSNGGEEVSNITVTFNTSYERLPTPTREGYEFLWWYNEDTKEKVDNKATVTVARNHTLCAVWNKNTVFFDVNGGEELTDSEKEKDVVYNDKYDSLPTPTRTGYTFDGWYDEDNKEITSVTTVSIVSNQTLYANWTANSYTIILDVNGGDELGEGEKKMEVTFDGSYDSLPIPSREGYDFVGWFNENNEEITNDTKVGIAGNQTLYARWTWINTNQTITPSKYVEIVFGKEGMTDEEIREILSKFTKEKFTIIRTEDSKTGETTVIIKFNDAEKAEEFIGSLNKSSDSARNFIRSASFNSGVDVSTSAIIYPLILLSILFI